MRYIVLRVTAVMHLGISSRVSVSLVWDNGGGGKLGEHYATQSVAEDCFFSNHEKRPVELLNGGTFDLSEWNLSHPSRFDLREFLIQKMIELEAKSANENK